MKIYNQTIEVMELLNKESVCLFKIGNFYHAYERDGDQGAGRFMDVDAGEMLYLNLRRRNALKIRKDGVYVSIIFF